MKSEPKIMYEQLEIEVFGIGREDLWEQVAAIAEDYFETKLEFLEVASAYVTLPHGKVGPFKMSVTVTDEVARG